VEKINCVLLIDDDETTNLLSSQIITKLDFARQIKICYNGVEALKFLEEFKKNNGNESPELILIDITMPLMNGFEFVEAFNKINFSNRNEVTSVILTSSSDLKYIRKAKRMGVNDYLIKPLTKGNLIQLLQNNHILI
jgi:response regulator of citrate/malate metabolism